MIRTRQVIDILAYAIAVTLLTFVVGAGISLLVGGDWVLVEVTMFITGWLLFGYGAVKLRPTPPWKRNRQGRIGKIREALDDESGSTEKREDTRVEAIVANIPAIGERIPPPDERLPMAAKLFVAGTVVLVSSFFLERAVIA